MENNKKYPLIIFGISFLYCCIFLLLSRQYQQAHDALSYIEYAKDIASGLFWKSNMGKEPGYSLLISPLFLLFSTPVAIMLSRIVNIVLVALSSSTFYLIIRTLLPRASIKKIFIFSLLFSLSPQLASFSALRVYSEPLQLFLNSVILFCFVKIFSNENKLLYCVELKFWIIAALAASYLIITKSFFLVYPLWLIFSILIYRILIRKTDQLIKVTTKAIVIFLCLSFLLPFLLKARNYKKDPDPYIARKLVVNLLIQTYAVEWNPDDAFKWGVFQISDNLGKHFFPNDAKRMDGVSGELITKSSNFIDSVIGKEGGYEILVESGAGEWFRLIQEHPVRYILYYCLNALNVLLFEGVYPDIYSVSKTALIHYIYIINAVILHFLYSIFIWSVIIGGILVYLIKYKTKLLSRLTPKCAIIVLSLGYFFLLAFHFNTELRYFHPFYINIYLLFALSCEFLIKARKGQA